jgi:hypothetical protein
MLCLGFWISEPFHFNGRKDLFPSIQNRGNNDDRINLIMDPESRDKKSLTLGVTTKFDPQINS